MPQDRNDPDGQRMMTKVSHLYHTRGMVQTEIARTLGLSQARVSRLLSSAEDAGIVRTIVVPPAGLNADLEQSLEQAFGLLEAHIVDAIDESERERTDHVGRALAPIFQLAPIDGKTIGFTSWSRSLRSFVANLQRFPRAKARAVVELLGGVGQPAIQHEATVATERLAQLTDAEALFLRVPGVVPTPEMRDAILASDPHARRALETMPELDIALVGIGNCTIVPPLVGGDNFFTQEQFDYVRSLGAVGEINLRFMDADGQPIASELDELVLGVSLDEIRRAERRIGVSGGAGKHDAVLAAVRGGWINVLVTDEETARYLLSKGPSAA
ncbi:sugar-binding transcriptional regulator [Microbacterium sp. NPDC055357]